MYYTTDSAKLDDTDPPPPPPVLQARRTSSDSAEKKGLTFVNVTPVTAPSPSSPAPDIARLLSSGGGVRRCEIRGNLSTAEIAQKDCLRPIIERQLAVRAEDSDDDDDAERTYAFPPPVDLDAYAAACRLPPAEETEDEREARFQRERCFGL